MAKQSKSPASSRPNQGGGNSSAVIRQQQTITATSGPLPPADEMGRYERVLSGAAGRIFAMAEQEQAHRHEQEKRQQSINTKVQEANVRSADANIRTQDASIREIRRGQWMAFALGAGYLAITLTLGLQGYQIAASVLGLSGVAAVATVFIKVRNKQ